MKPPFKADYDENADVLYIIGSDNRPAEADEINGVLFRYAQDNGELVGITILNPSMMRAGPAKTDTGGK